MGEAGAGGAGRAAGAAHDNARPRGARLNSWKEVARYFERDERTVKRWEAARGLPIHRLPGDGRSKIYAIPRELDEWLVGAPESAQADALEQPSPTIEAAVVPETTARERLLRRLSVMGLPVLAATIVAVALFLSLRPGSDLAEARGLGTRNAEALNLFQEGQHAWATRTAAGLAQAGERFTQAIVADPHFARAYSGLAKTLLLEREYADLPDDEAFPQALAAATRAAEIDPGLAEAHSELGFVDFYWLWRPAQAEGQFRKAIALDPRDVTSRIWFAGVLRLQRRFPEGLAQVAAAQALAPESTQVLITKAMLEVEGGRAEQGDRLLAEIELAEPYQMWPHRVRARDYLLSGRLQDYIREQRLYLALRPDPAESKVLDAAARGLESGGRETMLDAELKAQLSLNALRLVKPYQIAETYALLGNTPETIAWLHRAVGDHQLLVLGAFADPILSEARIHNELGFLSPIITGT